METENYMALERIFHTETLRNILWALEDFQAAHCDDTTAGTPDETAQRKKLDLLIGINLDMIKNGSI